MTKPSTFSWPANARVAVSITFDDARNSQLDNGLPILDEHGIKATFYVMPAAVESRLDGWRGAVHSGHEIGNHTVHHPCSANLPFVGEHSLESYDLTKMKSEIELADAKINDLLSVTPQTFAYPCCQTYVGSGAAQRSYVPLVADRFLAARGSKADFVNAPLHCDMAELSGAGVDGKSFDQIRPLIEKTAETGGWLVLYAHDVGDMDRQAVAETALADLCRYAKIEANRIYIDTVASVARHIENARA